MGLGNKFSIVVNKFNNIKLINKILFAVLLIGAIVIILTVTGVINLPGADRTSGSSLEPYSYNESDWEYKIVFENKSRDDHYTDAQAWGGDLLSITSQEEEEVVSRLVAAKMVEAGHNNGRRSFWTGGQYKEGSSDIPPSDSTQWPEERACHANKFCTTEAGTAKYWKWTDGTPWTYTNWTTNPGKNSEPNNAPGAGYDYEKCVTFGVRVTNDAYDPVFRDEEGSFGNWNDNSCPKEIAAVYKRKAV